MDDVSYYVAGSAGLCGAEWDPGFEGAKMTRGTDGLYTKLFKNVPAGEHQLKVTDGSWNNTWYDDQTGTDGGYDNYVLNLEAAADVKVVFDSVNEIVTVETGTFDEPTNVPGGETPDAPGGETPDAPGGETPDAPGGETPDAPGGETPDAPAGDYYLVGYINGADYGIKDDSANKGDYKFVNGKVTVEFTADSYVVVKNDAGTYYTTEAYTEETSAKLVADGDVENNKMKAPKGTLTFTLVENADGTLTLSYAAGGSTTTPGGSTTTPGGSTTTPGGSTTTPGGSTTTPGGNNTNKPNLPKDNNDSVLTLWAKVPAAWTTVNAYTWDASNAPQNGEWPGTAMTKDGEWYKIVITNKVANVIINNGSDQTPDLKVDSGKDLYVVVGDDKKATVYYADGTTAGGNNDNMGSGEAADENITGTQSNFRVVGNADWMGNWDPASDAGRMLEVSPGVYKQNFDNVQPGNYELKITQNGTWDKCWGDNGNNFCFSVSQACKITVTFTLNGEVGTISVKGIGITSAQTADISMVSVFVLMGLAVCAAGILIINKKKFI